MSKWSPQTTQAYAELGKQSHVQVLEASLRTLCGNLARKSVLDFGCGGGELSLLLAKFGAVHIDCVDQQPHLIEQTRRNIAVSPHPADRFDLQVGGEDHLASLGRYDLVLCSLMLMMCENKARLDRVTADLISRLEAAGRLVIVLTHPCFRDTRYRTFHYDMPEGFNYWSSGSPYDVVLAPTDVVEPVVITDYHWMLQDYTGAIHAGGGTIGRMLEVPGSFARDESPQGDPAYLLIEVARGPQPELRVT